MFDYNPTTQDLQLCRQRREAERQVVTPADFAAAVKSLDFNSGQALSDFDQYLLRPNFEPVTLGYVRDGDKRTLIEVLPEPNQLETHDYIDYIDNDAEDDAEEVAEDEGRDTRECVMTSLIGMYASVDAKRKGHRSDEGHNGEDDIPEHAFPSKVEHPLEVFQQLGLLYSRNHNQEDGDRPQGSNYVLVMSAYDDSIWVMWRPYILAFPKYELAKDLFAYGEFPGTNTDDPSQGTILFAKIANDWDDLNPSPSRELRFSWIYRTPSNRNNLAEPYLTSARRTAEGGLRRKNDFRRMLPREERS